MHYMRTQTMRKDHKAPRQNCVLVQQIHTGAIEMTPIEQAIKALEQSKQYAQNEHPAGSDWSDVYDACDAAIAALRAQPETAAFFGWDEVDNAMLAQTTRKATRDEKIVNPEVYEVPSGVTITAVVTDKGIVPLAEPMGVRETIKPKFKAGALKFRED